MFRITVLLFIALFTLYDFANAEVFLTREKALELTFPDATEIEKRRVFLTDDQHSRAEREAKTRIDSKLYIFYVAKKNGRETGYAVIDTHKLRTSTETVLYSIDRRGKLEKAEILAFFEPQDYMQGDRWIDLFLGKDLSSSLEVGKDVPNITGATITSHSFADATRKILAIYNIAIKNSVEYSRKD